MDTTIIQLSDLSKKYDSKAAVDHLNLTIRKGEVFGLLGPNGAGKSTTILMLLGLTEPTSGSAKVCGIHSTSNPVAVKRKVGYLPEDVGFYEDRTGIENLIYTAMLNRMAEKEARQKAEQLLNKMGLTDAAHKKTKTYSRGMRQRLGLADVLIKEPEVIILDEPTLGIDPKGVNELLGLIAWLSKEEKLTVLLSSHHLHQVQQVCDRVGLFVNGRLIAEGDLQTLSEQLFSGEPLVIEIQVSGPSGRSMDQNQLSKELLAIEGVSDVRAYNEKLHIACNRDVSQEISSVVVTSGIGLNHLQKKEYGLDDIYQRYFEGRDDYE